MKRRRPNLRKLVLFLLLGAIVNVAVAWGLALWWRPADPKQELIAIGNPRDHGTLSSTIWSRPGAERQFIWLGKPNFPEGRTKTFDWSDLSVKNEGLRQIDLLLSQSVEGSSLWSTARHFGTSRRTSRFDASEYARFRLHDFSWYSVDRRGWPSLALQCSFIPEGKTAQSVFELHTGLVLAPHKPTMFGTNRLTWLEIRVLPLAPIWPGFAINTLFYAAILWVVFAAPGRVRRWRRSKRGLCPACAYPVGQSPTCTECGAAVTPAHHPATLS